MKGHGWGLAAEGGRWAAREKLVVLVHFSLLLDLKDCLDPPAAPLKAR